MALEQKNTYARSSLRPTPHGLGVANRRETAQYIADLALEMRNLAKACDMITLQGLLEVAYYEAFSAATEIEVPPGEAERLREISRASAG
jgi:hypothetical protein